MSTAWETGEVVRATGGKCSGQWLATSVSIDTRTLAAGALFIALKGEQHDGHEFVAQALAQGAVAALVSRTVEGVDPARLVLVADTEVALQQLGVAARQRSHAKFIGITGSAGKDGADEGQSQ
jgi:UDP-N-acetylmuramyl pentapeptide synthase